MANMAREPEISLLKNAYMYCFALVFVLSDEFGYRLQIIHNGEKVNGSKVYETAKGAKIAFLKEWWYKAVMEDVKPNWSHFYPVDKSWLTEKLRKQQ